MGLDAGYFAGTKNLAGPGTRINQLRLNGNRLRSRSRNERYSRKLGGKPGGRAVTRLRVLEHRENRRAASGEEREHGRGARERRLEVRNSVNPLNRGRSNALLASRLTASQLARRSNSINAACARTSPRCAARSE